MQGRDLANFDHVKRELRIADADDKPADNLNSKSEDAQRILARLNTQEASQAGPSFCTLRTKACLCASIQSVWHHQPHWARS